MSKPPSDELTKLERLRILSIAEAAHLAGISRETLRRHYQSKILKISPGREGMRLKDVLELGVKKSA